ncbi:MAG: hypothetical protein AAF806_11445 [Bacteroidota bacterium]
MNQQKIRNKMKKWSLLLVVAIFAFIACNDDPELSNVLSYDGENFSAPQLPAGQHTFAVRFGEDELKDFIGKSLDEVTFYAGLQPESCVVRIFAEGTANEPGVELYNANVTDGLLLQDWTKHKIAGGGIEITGEDIWIAIDVIHAQAQQSIGCDAGPNQTDGDWLFRSDEPGWKSFSAGPESVNWNIRGVVAD